MKSKVGLLCLCVLAAWMIPNNSTAQNRRNRRVNTSTNNDQAVTDCRQIRVQFDKTDTITDEDQLTIPRAQVAALQVRSRGGARIWITLFHGRAEATQRLTMHNAVSTLYSVKGARDFPVNPPTGGRLAASTLAVKENYLTDTVVHHQPVGRERATFIIAARLDESGSEQRWRWEQLWARQIGDNRFEVCCIPFFVYDLALADEVETTDLDGKEYVVQRVESVRQVYIQSLVFPNVSRDVIIEEITGLGYLIEERWPGSRLIAIDAADNEMAQALADLLPPQRTLGTTQV